MNALFVVMAAFAWLGLSFMGGLAFAAFVAWVEHLAE